MVRKFTNIVCVYYNDKNYIPAKYNCPDIEVDDVMLLHYFVINPIYLILSQIIRNIKEKIGNYQISQKKLIRQIIRKNNLKKKRNESTSN